MDDKKIKLNKDSKRYNELTGKEWLQYSFSIWRELKKTNGEKKLEHPAMFPVQLASRVIEVFTKKQGVVLDPFLGVGSTVVAAYQKQRKGIGFELSGEFSTIARIRLKEEKKGILDGKDFIEPKIYNKDSRNLLDYVKVNSVDLCLTSPPYWNILNMKRTSDRKKISKYSDSSTDIGNINDYDSFLAELQNIFRNVYSTLKPSGHCVVVLMDIRKKDKFYPFHSDLADKMKVLGFELEDIFIWDRQHEYNNMKPLGFPYIFRANKVHEYVLIFKKRA